MKDVLVVGGGIIGASIAFELARRGAAVELLERASSLGAEATTASAGMLGAFVEDHPRGAPDHGEQGAADGRASRALWDSFAQSVEDAAGEEVRVDPCGSVRVAFDEQELARCRARADGEPLDEAALRRALPGVSPRALGAVRFAGDAVIDPPSFVRALARALEATGATVRLDCEARSIREEQGRATGVVLDGGDVARARWIVVACGAWTGALHPALPRTEPVRGQIVELRADPPVPCIVFGPGCYLSPRRDGRVLVGATMERVGFDKRVTADAVKSLLGAALRLWPELERAEHTRSWAGLRPFAPGDDPICAATDLPGLVAATGHGRNGILLAPLAAKRIAELVD